MLPEPLQELEKWQPFKIDALGLVTLLGANELDRALGKLTRSRFCEHLPLLAPFVISANSMTKEVPGATLYNITDGIQAHDVSGWFVRWLLSQKLGWNSTTVTISYNFQAKHHPGRRLLAFFISAIAFLCLVGVPAIQEDWYGFANAVALLVSSVVRDLVLGENRRALDIAAEDGISSYGTGHVMVKVFCALPGGRFVTILCPRGLVVGCLLTSPQPPHPRAYDTYLAISWVCTGVHMVCLGMATLASQLVCVVLLIVSTVLVVHGVGSDEFSLGTRISISSSDSDVDTRSAAFARVHMTPTEEEAMYSWHLFPQRSNTEWWDRYRKRPEHLKT